MIDAGLPIRVTCTRRYSSPEEGTPMIVRWPVFAVLFAAATVAHATVGFIPLASVDDGGAPRTDGIEVVELPSMRAIRNIPVATGFDYAAISPDGATLVVRESVPLLGTIAVYDARTGALRHRWPASGC
ncbi:MAG TPA: hypothetical protein VFL14_11140, partial [Xanthomonadales bacterium]|nr:hypothetical protein [Xanthomonadales bacterium]